ARADLAREERALAEVQGRDAVLAEAARAADERLKALRLELLAAEKDRERLEEERRRITAELEVEALEATGVDGEGGQVADEIATAEAEREAAERQTAALTLERDGLRGALAVADRGLSADDAAEASARERLDVLGQERAAAEVTLAERRLALEHLAAQLAERY